MTLSMNKNIKHFIPAYDRQSVNEEASDRDVCSCVDMSVMEGDIGLVAGRSQREKRRSYKDLLREEEEIAAQVRKSSKKRPKVTFCSWCVKDMG